MKERDIIAYFADNRRKVNILFRIAAAFLSLGMLFVISNSIHSLMSQSLDGIAFIDVAGLACAIFLFWPFSYIAIKGKPPRTWHPY